MRPSALQIESMGKACRYYMVPAAISFSSSVIPIWRRCSGFQVPRLQVRIAF